MPQKREDLISGIRLAAMISAFQEAMIALSRLHGGQPGPWIDEIEAKVVFQLKNAEFEGYAMPDQVDATDEALSFLNEILKYIRVVISNDDDEQESG